MDDHLKVIGSSSIFAVGDVSNRDPVKSFVRVNDQMPILVANINLFAENKPLQVHVKGKSFMGQINGPMLVALGHDLPNGYGLGPNVPGYWLSSCLYLCWCGTPAGRMSNNIKSDFNKNVIPRKGVGISR